MPLSISMLCQIPFPCYARFRYAWFRYAWFQFTVMPDSRFKFPRYAWFRYATFCYATFHFFAMTDSVMTDSVMLNSHFLNYAWFRYATLRYAQVRYDRFPIPGRGSVPLQCGSVEGHLSVNAAACGGLGANPIREGETNNSRISGKRNGAAFEKRRGGGLGTLSCCIIWVIPRKPE